MQRNKFVLNEIDEVFRHYFFILTNKIVKQFAKTFFSIWQIIMYSMPFYLFFQNNLYLGRQCLSYLHIELKVE